MDDDILLVWAMNGQPLLPQHGFPLRLIVPGWYGMASVKWLNRIELIDRPYDGHQQTKTYIYRQDENDPGTPVTTIRVKSLMVPPGIPEWYSERRLVEPGTIMLHGRAWSGSGTPINSVEVCVDGQWQPAVLDSESEKYAWRGWRCEWQATSGAHQLKCRASDANGETQPLEPRWDQGGFGNNCVQTVQVWCE
jgi:DMSO/TMAO reductase YedYZ molybdopterin-dependent catalytic subunit